MVIHEIASALSNEMAAKKDNLLLEVITQYFGHEPSLDLMVLASHRMRCYVVQNTGIETYCIDGIPVLEIHPMEYAPIDAEIDGHLTTTFKYRKLI